MSGIASPSTLKAKATSSSSSPSFPHANGNGRKRLAEDDSMQIDPPTTAIPNANNKDARPPPPKLEIQDFELSFIRPQNRGKKLRMLGEGQQQPLSALTQRPTLWPLVQFSDDTEIVSVGKRKVIRKKSRSIVEEDPYEGINIEDIWRLPEKKEDLQTIEPIKTTFRSRHIQLLSRELMKMVEEQWPFLRDIQVLASIIQGEDTTALVEDITNTKDIDRKKLMAISTTTLKESFKGDDERLLEAQLVVEEMSAVMNEYIERLHEIRKLLIRAHLQKKKLALKLNIFGQQ